MLEALQNVNHIRCRLDMVMEGEESAECVYAWYWTRQDSHYAVDFNDIEEVR